MRPYAVAWAARHGLPSLLVPDYVLLAVVAAILSGAIALRLARRDGADLFHARRALALAYLGALVGGYLFEWLRALPQAIADGHVWSIFHTGRAAYGGLLGSILAAGIYLVATKQPIGAFYDRVAIGCGISFALVRTGCFLAGCDYGRPTALPFGVRFPAGSSAAIDHAARGWIPAGAPSLPVHPTELYEAGVGIAAALVALYVVRKRRQDGSAFLATVAVYAIGRFCVELLRGDVERGSYAGLSTAQWVSIVLLWIVAALAIKLPQPKRPPNQLAPSTRSKNQKIASAVISDEPPIRTARS